MHTVLGTLRWVINIHWRSWIKNKRFSTFNMHTNAEVSSSCPSVQIWEGWELGLEICPLTQQPSCDKDLQKQSLRNNKRIVSLIKTKHKNDRWHCTKISGGRKTLRGPGSVPEHHLLEDSHQLSCGTRKGVRCCSFLPFREAELERTLVTYNERENPRKYKMHKIFHIYKL